MPELQGRTGFLPLACFKLHAGDLQSKLHGCLLSTAGTSLCPTVLRGEIHLKPAGGCCSTNATSVLWPGPGQPCSSATGCACHGREAGRCLCHAGPCVGNCHMPGHLRSQLFLLQLNLLPGHVMLLKLHALPQPRHSSVLECTLLQLTAAGVMAAWPWDCHDRRRWHALLYSTKPDQVVMQLNRNE